jgi:hypothetical protein
MIRLLASIEDFCFFLCTTFFPLCM